MSCGNLDYAAVWPWAVCAPRPVPGEEQTETERILNRLCEVLFERSEKDRPRPRRHAEQADSRRSTGPSFLETYGGEEP